MMLALGVVGALSSVLFLTDMSYALSNLARQKSQKRSSSPQYPVPRKWMKTWKLSIYIFQTCLKISNIWINDFHTSPIHSIENKQRHKTFNFLRKSQASCSEVQVSMKLHQNAIFIFRDEKISVNKKCYCMTIISECYHKKNKL